MLCMEIVGRYKPQGFPPPQDQKCTVMCTLQLSQTHAWTHQRRYLFIDVHIPSEHKSTWTQFNCTFVDLIFVDLLDNFKTCTRR